MAGGNGGFTIRTRGFDREEVNEYISNLRKRMTEMEANLKANDKKTEEAVKAASTADQRVEEAKKAGEEKAAELGKKLTIEQHTAETLRRQVDELRAKLDAEKHKFSEMLKSGNGVNSEAKKAYSEIIAKGETDAKEIVAKAQAQADEIISAAQAKREQAEKDLSDFLKLFNDELDGMNRSYSNLINVASALLGTGAAAPAVTERKPSVPEKTAQNDAPKPQPASRVVTETVPTPEPVHESAAAVVEPAFQTVPEASAMPELPDLAADAMPDLEAAEKLDFEPVSQLEFEPASKPAPKPVSKQEEKPEEKPEQVQQSDDEIPDFLKDDFVFSPVMPKDEPKKQEFPAGSESSAAKDEDEFNAGKTNENSVFEEWGGGFAGDIFNNESKETEEGSSDDGMDLFSSDMFANLSSDGDDDMTSDLSAGFGGEDISVAPLDAEREEKVSFDRDFTSELIGQTMPSSMLGSDVDESVREAVRTAEEKFAVKPTDEHTATIDFDMLDFSDSVQPEKQEDEADMADFDSDESELQKALREAEEALNSLGGTAVSAGFPAEPEEKEERAAVNAVNSANAASAANAANVASSANPWEDLQKQLEELDRSGGAIPENDEPAKEPSAPSADDSSIWNFGDTAGGDDDMSSDMFSGFGGL